MCCLVYRCLENFLLSFCCWFLLWFPVDREHTPYDFNYLRFFKFALWPSIHVPWALTNIYIYIYSTVDVWSSSVNVSWILLIGVHSFNSTSIYYYLWCASYKKHTVGLWFYLVCQLLLIYVFRSVTFNVFIDIVKGLPFYVSFCVCSLCFSFAFFSCLLMDYLDFLEFILIFL